RPVIAMAELDEGLRQDQLGRTHHRHRDAERLAAMRMREPLLRHRQRAMAGGEDHVEEVLPAMHLADPALVLDLDAVPAIAEMAEDAAEITGLAEDVEVLGRAADAGVDRERIGAGEQERRAKRGQLAEALGIERLRLRRGRAGYG